MKRITATAATAALIGTGSLTMSPLASAHSDIPVCQPGQVFYTMWMTDNDDEMKPEEDFRYLFLHAKNESRTTCVLNGYPTFSFYGSNGTKFNVIHKEGGNLTNPGKPALTHIVLQPLYQTGMYVKYPIASTPEQKEWTVKAEVHAGGTTNTEKVHLFAPEEALTITEGTTVVTSSWYVPEIADPDKPEQPRSTR